MVLRFSENALKIVIFLLFLTFQKVIARQSPNLLIQKLINPDDEKPKAIILRPKGHLDIDDHESSAGSGRSSSSQEMPKKMVDEEVYQLYGLLRSDIAEGPLSPSLEDKVSNSKHLLEKALRSRCGRLESCLESCGYRRNRGGGCQRNCKKVFDNLNLCDKTTTTCRTSTTRCRTTTSKDPCAKGKTMPPRWLLRMLLRNGLNK